MIGLRVSLASLPAYCPVRTAAEPQSALSRCHSPRCTSISCHLSPRSTHDPLDFTTTQIPLSITTRTHPVRCGHRTCRAARSGVSASMVDANTVDPASYPDAVASLKRLLRIPVRTLFFPDDHLSIPRPTHPAWALGNPQTLHQSWPMAGG